MFGKGVYFADMMSKVGYTTKLSLFHLINVGYSLRITAIPSKKLYGSPRNPF